MLTSLKEMSFMLIFLKRVVFCLSVCRHMVADFGFTESRLQYRGQRVKSFSWEDRPKGFGHSKFDAIG